MSATTIPPGPPEIPLKPDLLAAYKALYDQYEASIEGTADTDLLASLNESQLAVAAVINLNNKAIIAQDTASYEAVLKQMTLTHKGLDELQKQIAKIAGKIKLYSGILDGITKVVSMVPGI